MEQLIELIRSKYNTSDKRPFIIAIDGRCASGKTTLAEALSDRLDGCPVVHTDDFFLTPTQRTKERLNEAGGNFDRERFVCEVTEPLMRNGTAVYRVYSCKLCGFEGSVKIEHPDILIVEGAYSMHPYLGDIYGFRIFCSTDHSSQLERIEKRNGTDAKQKFKDMWIPMEEKYFKEYKIADMCDYNYKT